MRVVIMTGNHWTPPQEGENEVRRSSTSCPIKAAAQVWEKNDFCKVTSEDIQNKGIENRRETRYTAENHIDTESVVDIPNHIEFLRGRDWGSKKPDVLKYSPPPPYV